MVIIALKFATLSEQHVAWGNQINYISMGPKLAILYEQYVEWGSNINFIFIRDQNSPAPRHPLNFIFISTWSQTRRNVRVQQCNSAQAVAVTATRPRAAVGVGVRLQADWVNSFCWDSMKSIDI